MIRKALPFFAYSIASAILPTSAFAQESTLIEPAVPVGFDRGVNVSVLDRARPDYDPLGIYVGSFRVFPQVETGIGYSDNVYLNDSLKRGDVFVSFAPQVRVRSDWNRHELQLRGGLQAERYLDETRRNQTAFDVGTLGRLDIGSSYIVTGEAQLARRYETPFTGAVASDVAVLSNYLRNFLALRAAREVGQSRLTVAVDHTGFDFNNVELGSGAFLNQQDRDRVIDRVTGQAEYAFSPSLALYGQVNFGVTDYSRPLNNGLPNRDSHAVRAIGGANFDLASLIRGTVGIGYVWRDYRSVQFRDVSGVSVEAQVEWFPTELTTITGRLSRLIEDSSIGNNAAYFNNLALARVDHELLRNMIVSVGAEYSQQDYIDSNLSADTYRFSLSARYLSSRRVSLRGTVSYAGRTVDNVGTAFGGGFKEARGLLSLVLHP